MGAFIKYFLFAIIILFSACSKEDFMDMPSLSNEFLAQKSIYDIRIFNDEVWVRSERPCDTCNVPGHSSYIPVISQLGRIKGSDYRYDESKPLVIPVADNRGNLYTATKNEILKINDIKNYTSVLKTGDFEFTDFGFDKNNHIWMSGNKGIASWDGKKLTVYDTSNSDLTSNITHGMAVDGLGNIWITLDFKNGVLKISDGRWEIFGLDRIDGSTSNSYFSKPVVDKDNRVWFTVINSPYSTNVVNFDGKSWTTEFPQILRHGQLFADSQGKIWRLNHIIDTSSTMKFTLQYLAGESWINYDVSDISHLILSLDADMNNVYLGTADGLVVKRR